MLVKLRILGDSVRLRLSQSDVQTLLASGRVEERTHFPSGAVLLYAVEAGDGEAIEAALDGTNVVVRIPRAAVTQWGESDEVTLQAEQPVGADQTLALLIEKDFKCAVPRPGEEDYDGFPNPDVTC